MPLVEKIISHTQLRKIPILSIWRADDNSSARESHRHVLFNCQFFNFVMELRNISCHYAPC